MAKIAQTSVTGCDTGIILQEFFDDLNCSLITVTNDGSKVYININNEVSLKIQTKKDAGATNSAVVTCDSISANLTRIYSPLFLTVCCTDDLFYIQANCDALDSGYRRWCMIYEQLDNFSIYGYWSYDISNTKPFINIEDLNIYDIGVSPRNSYKYQGKIQSGTMSNSDIVYTNNAFLRTASGNTIVTESHNFVSCSTIQGNSMVTFHGKDYYAIGSNILIPIDN